jgi:hypothetical protein
MPKGFPFYYSNGSTKKTNQCTNTIVYTIFNNLSDSKRQRISGFNANCVEVFSCVYANNPAIQTNYDALKLICGNYVCGRIWVEKSTGPVPIESASVTGLFGFSFAQGMV